MQRLSAQVSNCVLLGLLIVLGLSCLSAGAQSATCVAGTWVTPNLNGTGTVGDWPVNASSTHFDLHYDPAMGTPDPTQMQNALAMMETIWTQFMGPPINWPEPFCNSAVKDKASIFVSDAFYANSGGFNNNDMGMYWGPELLTTPDVAGYEFVHALQFNANGLFGTNYGGWFWESHSAFMTFQLPENHQTVGCGYVIAAEPHLYYGSDRDNFCTWLFWEYEKDQYGYTGINNIWANAPRPNTAGAPNADPLYIYASNMGWSVSQLNDEFGRWAMANVNWDYIDPDGNNTGALLRSYIGPNTANSGINDPYTPNWTRNRLTQLNATNLSQRVFQVPSYWAPQRFGYNLIRLVPDAGASSVTVNFTGLAQAEAANTNFSGLANVPAAIPPPNSDWRWGLVAIDVDGNSRKSPLQSGASASLTFDVQPDDQGLYMVVVGASTTQQSIQDLQVYFTIYRYPYQIQLENAMPDGYQAGFQRVNPAGSTWSNGGGFVASGVTVGSNVYIGPHAAVLGGSVTGNAVITDNATVWNGTVSGSATVGALTQWNDNLNISGSAVVKAVKDVQGILSPAGTSFSGTVQMLGAVEEYFSPGPTSGVYFDFLPESDAGQAAYGGNLTAPPVEVTAPIQIGSTAQTITLATVPAQAAGSYYALTASASSGLPVGLFSQTQTVCTVAGSVVDAIASGTCTLLASQPGNTTYAAAPTVTSSFTVNAANSQTITFPAIPAQIVGTQLPLYAWASSSLAVTFTSQTSNTCTVSGTTLTMVATGNCSVTAAQSGNGAYSAAAPVAQTFAIVPQLAQSIIFPPVATVEVAIGNSYSPVVEATSGLPVTLTSQTTSICTISGEAINLIAAGTCTVTATQPGNAFYQAAPAVTVSFPISGLRPQIIVFPLIPTQAPGVTVNLSAVTNSAQAITYSSSTPSVCTVTNTGNNATGTVTTIVAGTCTVTAAQPGGWVYAAATPVTQSFTVTSGASFTLSPASASLTIAQGNSTTDAITVTPVNGFGGAVTFSTELLPANMTATFSPNPTSSKSAQMTLGVQTAVPGTYTFNVIGISGSLAASIPVTVVATGTQTITFPQIGTQQLGATIWLNASVSSGNVAYFVSSTPSICSVSGSSATMLAVGTCTIVAEQGANPLYTAAANVSNSFQVVTTPTAQTISFAAIPTQTVGTPLALSATASSGLAVSFAASPSTVCSVSGSTATFVGAGSCTITAAQSGNSTYAAATSVSQTFTVKSNQSFTLSLSSPSVTIPAGGQGATDYIYVTPAGGFSSSVTLSATLPQGISDAFVQPGNVTSTSALFVLAAGPSTKPGAYVIPISGVSGSLNATTNLTVNVTGTQTITFNSIAAQTVGTPLTLAATASSGLVVSYAASPSTVCTVSGAKVTFAGAGTCTIIASQSGNTYYSAATSVSQSFSVKATGASFTLSAATGTLSQVPGASTGVTDAITVNPANGFTGTVTFTVSGIPAGVDYAFTSTSSTSGTTFVIYVPAGVAASTNNKIVITGTSGATTAQTTVTLNIP